MNITNIEKKEDVKKVIDRSTDYKELYENSIKVLQTMESKFKDTLDDIAYKEKWDREKKDLIWETRFDNNLDTNNPVTIFEKKGKDLVERSKDIAENSKLGKACVELGKMVGIKRLDDRSKQVITDELRTTRTNAIQDFKKDISDGILSNSNNVKFSDRLERNGEWYGEDLFYQREADHKGFEEKIDRMPLLQLAYTTFHMYEGSGGYKYCYTKLKEKLGNENLFDYIDSLKKPGDQTFEILRYSSLSMLFFRGEADDLKEWLPNCRGKKDILTYVRSTLKSDEKFKVRFLTGIKKLEKIADFKKIADELKQQDPKIQKAYEMANNFDNADVFKNKKVNALMVYDDAGRGSGGSYFQSEFEEYKKNGFGLVKQEDNSNYTRYTLQKGTDKITMVKIKANKTQYDGHYLKEESAKTVFTSIVNNVDYNLFALRGHCYNTDKMAYALGGLKAVGSGDILIDGGCNNSRKIGDYRKKGVKGYMFAYNGEGRGDSTKSFINRIIKEKSSKSFSDIMKYYNTLDDTSTRDGYFAENVERPDTVAYQYKVMNVGKY